MTRKPNNMLDLNSLDLVAIASGRHDLGDGVRRRRKEMSANWSDFAKIAAPSPKRQSVPATQAPRRAVKTTAPVRVGGSPGAASTHWDPNYKPPVERVKANAKMKANEMASLEKNRMYNEIRRLKYMELNKMFPPGEVPISESRKAFCVTSEDVQKYLESQSGVK